MTQRTIHMPHFEPELIQRYDVPGPRYTSYPPANHFHDRFDDNALHEAIQRSNQADKANDISLYVHVPFCMSPCFYCGCNRIITRDTSRSDDYLEALDREAALLAERFEGPRPVRQLHFGGGTPNFLDPQRMRHMMKILRSHFHFPDQGRREYGIEIDPRFADADYILGLGELGFNRMSVGIQDFDPVVQKAVNRIQGVDITRAVIEAGRKAGFESVSVDLIYGLPRQSIEGFRRTLDEVIQLAPDRLAVYGYAHMPQLFKAQKQIKQADLPSPATRLQLLGSALEKLTAAGYVYIGMDHFARQDDDLVRAQQAGTLQRNFQGYSTHADCDIVGLGVSAISRIGDSYSQNNRDLPGYYLALQHHRLPVMRGLRLNRDDQIRRSVIGELMCHRVVRKQAFAERHQLDFERYFANDMSRLTPLIDDGLVCNDPDAIRVTDRGQLLLRNVAMCFDAWLSPAVIDGHYSRAI